MDPVETAHAFEQGEAGLIQIAKMLGAFYNELIKQGLSREDAFELVKMQQQGMLFVTNQPRGF